MSIKLRQDPNRKHYPPPSSFTNATGMLANYRLDLRPLVSRREAIACVHKNLSTAFGPLMRRGCEKYCKGVAMPRVIRGTPANISGSAPI